MHKIRRRLMFACGLQAMLGTPMVARASGFPERPLKLIMAYPPGGGADQWARIIARPLEAQLGQPIVFDYRPGGSATSAADAAARAANDGYTIHMIDSTALAYVPNLRRVSYDPTKSFTPLGYVGAVPMCIVATPSISVRSVEELVALASKKPGQLNCASAGVGSPHHLIAEFFKIRAGIRIGHIPYKGATQYLSDLAAGQVQLAVSTIAPAVPYVQSGRLRVLGVTTAQRVSAMLDVPTIAEQGYPGFDEKPWSCFVAPTGLPSAVLERLRAALQTVLGSDEVAAALRQVGLEDIHGLAVEKVSGRIAEDLAKWKMVIQQAGITLES